MGCMTELTEHERARVAAVLEQLLAEVKAGGLKATPGQAAYLAGTVKGLRGRVDATPLE